MSTTFSGKGSLLRIIKRRLLLDFTSTDMKTFSKFFSHEVK